MRALTVVSHPDPQSFTHAIAHQLMAGIESHPGQQAELADLAAEGFDPRFSPADHAAIDKGGPVAPAILAEQRRIDRADLLVLVYPVYWWSFPGLMKGWIDRVFIRGWAYDDLAEGGPRGLLGRLPVRLVGVGGADAGTYARRNYAEAMRVQIEQGIFGYCGAPVASSDLLLHSDEESRQAALRQAFAIGNRQSVMA